MIEVINNTTKLAQLDSFNDTEELATALLETTEAGFTLFEGEFKWERIGLLVALFAVVRDGVDNSKDMFRELAIMTNDDFDNTFSRAAAGFDLANNENEHDIKGITKALFHALRMSSRGKLNTEETTA